MRLGLIFEAKSRTLLDPFSVHLINLMAEAQSGGTNENDFSSIDFHTGEAKL